MNGPQSALVQADVHYSAEKVSHDLRAPVVNIDGFARELREAVTKLDALFRRHAADLPGDFQDEAAALIAEDIAPCLDFLSGAVDQLDSRIDNFTRALLAGSS